MFENKLGTRVVATLAGRSEYTLERGIGVNWHHNWFPAGAPRDSVPLVSDSVRWQRLMDELDVARPSCLRFGYAAGHFCDEHGSLDFETEGFRALSLLDRWARENRCVVAFDPWGVPRAYSHGDQADGSYADAPRDKRAYVDRFLIPIMQHIRHELQLESVRDFILLNEPLTYGEAGGPDVPYRTPRDVDHFAHYVEVHRLLREQMESLGLDFQIIGPDTNSTLYWAVDFFRDRDLDLTPYIDAYDQHSYWVRFDYLPPNPQVAKTVPVGDSVDHAIRTNARFARAHGKAYYITELGTFYYGWRRGDPYGPARHDAFVLEAELIVRSMQVGVGGFYRWAFVAPGAYADGVWAFVNTVDDSYTRQPNTFYGYASLMRYSEAGARVWVTETDEHPSPYRHVHVVGLELPDGEHTVIAVNNHWCQERVLDLRLPPEYVGRPYQRFLTDSTRKMHRLDLGETDALEAILPPMSVVVFTSARRPGDDRFPPDIDVHTPY